MPLLALGNQRVLEANLKPVLVANNPLALVASNPLDSGSHLKIISVEAALAWLNNMIWIETKWTSLNCLSKTRFQTSSASRWGLAKSMWLWAPGMGKFSATRPWRSNSNRRLEPWVSSLHQISSQLGNQLPHKDQYWVYAGWPTLQASSQTLCYTSLTPTAPSRDGTPNSKCHLKMLAITICQLRMSTHSQWTTNFS